ncbi:uncharacterized protein KQ657_004980 [Scheffersomyces spartinae]|uniref:SCP domain-containing protein n=1 Tax=Scheffersomyces spartinae TaxID=45513 RepID=A0A9P7VAF2_9ASCO|nr:uncharacterized protein KQ657_004980 [Scheffersomyces spartinae]KAG7194257.1 hypothetical protein KQ657_004980 [Scheffersomyces spartinae]
MNFHSFLWASLFVLVNFALVDASPIHLNETTTTAYVRNNVTLSETVPLHSRHGKSRSREGYGSTAVVKLVETHTEYYREVATTSTVVIDETKTITTDCMTTVTEKHHCDACFVSEIINTLETTITISDNMVVPVPTEEASCNACYTAVITITKTEYHGCDNTLIDTSTNTDTMTEDCDECYYSKVVESFLTEVTETDSVGVPITLLPAISTSETGTVIPSSVSYANTSLPGSTRTSLPSSTRTSLPSSTRTSLLSSTRTSLFSSARTSLISSNSTIRDSTFDFSTTSAPIASITSKLSESSKKPSKPTSTAIPKVTADVYADMYLSKDLNITFAKEILDYHNRRRNIHQAPDLSWNKTLYDYAQAYADRYTCGAPLVHSGGPYGENISSGYSTPARGARSWYNERHAFKYGIDDLGTSGHFTQMMWISTTQLGCAYKDCGTRGLAPENVKPALTTDLSY